MDGIMNVKELNLLDVFEKYTGNREFEGAGKDQWLTICPFHGDTAPSLRIYKKGRVWDYCCYSCKKPGHAGNAITLVKHLGLADTYDEATKKIMEDFNLVYPDKVTMGDLADIKGFDFGFLTQLGVQNVEEGVMFPFKDVDGNTIAKKIRLKYVGKPKYKYTTEEGYANTALFGMNEAVKHDSDTIYVCEGETDCITLLQNGYPAVGVGGAASWGNVDHSFFDRYSKIVIVRDSDDAGEMLVNAVSATFPEKTFFVGVPMGAKDVNDLWHIVLNDDKERFNRVMAPLEPIPAKKEAFLALIEQDAKYAKDVDIWVYMLAKELTSKLKIDDMIDDICELVGGTVKEKEALKRKVGLAIGEAKPAADSLKSTFESENPIVERDGKYFKEIVTKGIAHAKELSNFVIRTVAKIQTDDTYVRQYRLVNTNGFSTPPISFTGQELMNVFAFNAKCFDHGDFIFKGDTSDLLNILNRVIDESKSVEVLHSPHGIGMINGDWLFGNCAVGEDGQVYRVNDAGIIKTAKTSYLPRAIDDGECDDGGADMPLFVNPEWSNADKRRYIDGVRRAYGNHMGTWLAIGWGYAGFMGNYVFKKYARFPIMSVAGRTGSGKTIFTGSIYGMFGFNQSCGMQDWRNSTKTSMESTLGYKYNMPAWYDDFRGDDNKAKSSILLNVFNRVASSKGIANSGKTHKKPIRGYLLLSGEGVTGDPAISSRSVHIALNGDHNDKDAFEDVRELMLTTDGLGIEWAKETMDKQLVAAYLEEVDNVVRHVSEQKLYNDRISTNYAICAAGFIRAFREVLTAEEIVSIIRYVGQCSVGADTDNRDMLALTQFLDAIPHMIDKGYINAGVEYEYDVKDTASPKLHIKLNRIHEVWLRYYNPEGVTSYNSIKDNLVNEKFCKHKDGGTINVRFTRDAGSAKEEHYQTRAYTLDIDGLQIMAPELYNYSKYKYKLFEDVETPAPEF